MAVKGRVLVVWSDEEQAVRISDRFSTEGLKTDSAGSYAEALMLLASVAYDVVVAEHHPPRIDCRKLIGAGTFGPSRLSRPVPVIVIVPLHISDIAYFFRKGAFDVIREDSALAFIDKLPFAVDKALEEQRLSEQKRSAEERLQRERLISEATLQSVINGVVFINNAGIIEKINAPLEGLLGKDVVQLGVHVCTLSEDNLIRQLFLKPLEGGACWELKGCATQGCPAFGKKDCLCWFIESACEVCGLAVAETDRFRRLMQCAVYKKAHEGYYSAPVELDYRGKFLNVYRRHVLDERGALIGEIFDFIDMTPERDFREQLRRLSITDSLTGLHNRRYVTERVIEEFHEGRRYGRELSIIIIDIDNFKTVNDTYGHPAGDEVLRQLAALLEREKRKSDVAGRYGGEEFVLVMPHTGKLEAAAMAERLRKKFEERVFTSGGRPFSLTISLGVSSLTAEIREVDDLLKLADTALYTAKAQGKNRVAVV